MKWICVAVVQVAVLISSESGIYHRGGWYLVIEVVVVEGNTVIIVVMVTESVLARTNGLVLRFCRGSAGGGEVTSWYVLCYCQGHGIAVGRKC